MSPLPPDTVLPHVLAAVAEVFGASARPDDSFFSAGGDSVAAVWLADLLEERLDTEVEVSLVLSAASFTALAAELASGPAHSGTTAEKG
ncbi:acyl carrier protein [Kitasatospora sp. NPDC093558]|uniref:acyl carrier protein n=1 Tax=Kitasatospora sp. NPDC093558 TaxID=3155201 RepID=UPI00344883E7